MACAGARALHSLSESRLNKEAMRKHGLVTLLPKLLKSVHIDLVTPVMGTVSQCASEVATNILNNGSFEFSQFFIFRKAFN